MNDAEAAAWNGEERAIEVLPEDETLEEDESLEDASPEDYGLTEAGLLELHSARAPQGEEASTD